MRLTTHLDDKEKNLHKKKAAAYRVLRMTQTKGWKEIIEPTLDAMICSIVGGKVKDRWTIGLLFKARTEERREYYVGYKQALIDLFQKVYGYVDGVKKLENQIKTIHKARDAKTQVPMLEETEDGE